MYIADLHIHSRYSRATSRDGDAPHLDLWARRKGIGLLGTGDFTHPAWRAELTDMLEEAEEGLYRLRDEYRLPCETAGDTPRFVVSGEISTIYKRGGKTRKVHHVILLPGLEAAETLSHRLEAIGNLHSDGRPILGLDSRDLLEITLDCCPDAIYIPAHIWTPHFSLFGAFSDFSTLEDKKQSDIYISTQLARTSNHNDINRLAIKFNPQNEAPYLNIIDDLVEYNNYNQALDFYNNDYCAMFPDNRRIDSIVGLCWFLSDKYSAIGEYYNAVQRQKKAIELELGGGNNE